MSMLEGVENIVNARRVPVASGSFSLHPKLSPLLPASNAVLSSVPALCQWSL